MGTEQGMRQGSRGSFFRGVGSLAGHLRLDVGREVESATLACKMFMFVKVGVGPLSVIPWEFP